MGALQVLAPNDVVDSGHDLRHVPELRTDFYRTLTGEFLVHEFCNLNSDALARWTERFAVWRVDDR